ncbi:MAG: glycosyltransferase family A protein [Nodosilinea sp.]
MEDVSIVVLVKNRQRHLRNLLRGMQRLTYPASEVVVVHMNEAEQPRPIFFTSRYVSAQVEHPTSPLPLAQARNRGACLAQGKNLIFLDVDCIPSARLVADYWAALAKAPAAIAMGAVYYLSIPLSNDWDETALVANSRPHSARTYLQPGALRFTQDYHLFWSLNFAVSKAVFCDQIGGFDEAFCGYGAEDTDFAMTAQAAGVPLAWAGCCSAFHQYHDHYLPPLQHFHDILRNATVFHRKWGWWPMEKWLGQFVQAGYICWSTTAKQIEVVAAPTAEAIAAARQSCLPQQTAE